MTETSFLTHEQSQGQQPGPATETPARTIFIDT